MCLQAMHVHANLNNTKFRTLVDAQLHLSGQLAPVTAGLLRACQGGAQTQQPCILVLQADSDAHSNGGTSSSAEYGAGVASEEDDEATLEEEEVRLAPPMLAYLATYVYSKTHSMSVKYVLPIVSS